MAVSDHAARLVYNDSIGGNLNDYIEGGDGMDFVLGDNGKILLSDEVPYKLMQATTICAQYGGNDHIILGENHDIAFGGEFLCS